MFHLIYLQLSQLILPLLALRLLNNRLLLLLLFPSDRFWHIFAILKSFLSCIHLFLFWFWYIGSRLNAICIYAFYLTRKLLNHYIITCILSCFFFFYTHYYPPILAPRPPSFTHSLLLFLSTLLE